MRRGVWEGKERARRPAKWTNIKFIAFGGKATNTMKKKILVMCFLVGCHFLQAQEETVQLDEAVISDRNLVQFVETQTKTILSDSILNQHTSSMTDLLQFNSSIYFKENGAGMVSSPSFRGTSASHTAVIWNGVNVNSSFLGQADFNVLNIHSADQLVIKSGGGSVAYGSSAIGGSIHLNNELNFRKGFENQILANYGSFNRYGLNFQSKYSDEKISLNFQFGRNGSDNDFKIAEQNRNNRNGQFYHQYLSVATAYKLNSKNILKWYGNISDSDRNFSLISSNAQPSKYEDYSTKSMLEWDSKLGKFQSNLKGIYLGEKFEYFPHSLSSYSEKGDGKTYMLKYDLGYHWKNLWFNLNLEAQHTEVQTSKIDFAKRQIGSASFQMKHRISSKILYEASLRQELSDVYTSPFLYALGLKYNPTQWYELRLNTSKNFRMPTFNDLFWPGSGNENLNPETSVQYELANQFRLKNLSFGLIAYQNSIENYIQWVPSGSLSVPENLGEVSIWGLESNLKYDQKFHHHRLEFNASYAYTESKNKATDKQLIYVPYHKFTSSVGYSWKGISAFYQFMYNGSVYTDSGNRDELDGYSLSNMGINYGIGKTKQYRIGFQILNLLDEVYQNVENRTMPGRNYNITIDINF